MNDLVVTDTSCLIALDRVGRIDILPGLYAVHAPEAVVEEFGSRPPWLTVERVAEADVAPLLVPLHRGEAEAIVLAASLPDAVLLIDEARGRVVASRFGLSVIGTGGILIAAKEHGLIGAVRPLLDTLRGTYNFRLSDHLYAEIVRLAGES